MSTLVDIENLNVSISGKCILKDISLKIDSGSIIALLGPNGAGKTTLIKAILGLIKYEGSIKTNAKLGYVPQNPTFHLPFPITVRELFYINTIKLDHSALNILEMFRVNKLLDKNINRLSGGELQRLYIAQEIMKKPQLLIMDEPSSALDIEGQEVIFDIMDKIRKEEETSFLIISHDISMINKHATDMIHLNQSVHCQGKADDAMLNKELEKLYGDSFKHFHHHH
jgi:zinc transport system ATP-binding protein